MTNNLGISWLILLVEILILSFFKNIITDYATVGFGVVGLHVLVTVFLLFGSSDRFSGLIVTAFLLRFLVMLWDIYGKSVFVLPSSGFDTEFYYQTAIKISEDLNLVFSGIRGGVYAKILGILFALVGPMRILAQYMNVLIGLMTVITIYQVLDELKINSRVAYIVITIASFFPYSLIMSGVLLREIFPTYLIAISLLYFVGWYKNQSIVSFVSSLLLLGIGSMFHSGVIGVAVGYLFMFLFLNQSTQKFEINVQNVLKFLPVVVLIFLFATQFGDAIFFKFRNLQNPSDIYENVTSAMGGSAYLEGMAINSPMQLTLFSPIRAFYFLFSPFPMDWRGGVDIFSFFMDSLFYFYVVYYFFKNRKWFVDNKKLIIALLIIILIVAFIFGIGVSNAGTAMRHRQKIIPVFMVMLALMMNEKYKTVQLNGEIKTRKVSQKEK